MCNHPTTYTHTHSRRRAIILTHVYTHSRRHAIILTHTYNYPNCRHWYKGHDDAGVKNSAMQKHMTRLRLVTAQRKQDNWDEAFALLPGPQRWEVVSRLLSLVMEPCAIPLTGQVRSAHWQVYYGLTNCFSIGIEACSIQGPCVCAVSQTKIGGQAGHKL